MASLLKKLFGIAPRVGREAAMDAFNKRYVSFKELLQANADLAGVMAGLDATLRGDKHMETSEVRKQARRAIFHCERMASTLSEMSGQCDISLGSAVHSIAARIEHELDQHTRGDVPQFTLPLSEVDASMAYSVGGKNANLGELRNMLDMPVPRGFSITIRACSTSAGMGASSTRFSTCCDISAISEGLSGSMHLSRRKRFLNRPGVRSKK